MPKWTEEQQLAIDKENTNIIVSAGAGSGKTAVLTARVLRKLKNGININNLLILTFTKKAAFEMKNRIRKEISENKDLINQLDYIDSSYITTFDSFSLSIAKKYSYLLNISKDVKIADASIIYLEKKKIIDKIFDLLYEEENELFLKLLNDFTIKKDDDIKDYILDISNKLDLKYDKKNYLNTYIDNFYSDDNIDNLIKEYNDLLKNKISEINNLITQLSYHVDSTYLNSIMDVLNPLFNSDNYESIKCNIEFKMPPLPKNSVEDAKNIKDMISGVIKSIKELVRFDDCNELIDTLKSTKDYVKIIIEIINKLDDEIYEYKKNLNIYEFTDIAKLAIKLLDDNPVVCLELKEMFNEIMIDEYQDTSDLQELFISKIENNNVYMVGDIKQSIYRFRNANPYLFKDKYDRFKDNIGGYKIDLTRNFRSRREVIDDINLIFSYIMTDKVGGADYKSTHKMVFGNKVYDEQGKTSISNDFEIYNYEYDKELGYSKEEIEIFFIAQDIKNKIENKYQIFDKDLNKLRDAQYKDFAILLDKSVNFDLYKKIFQYFNIPMTKYNTTNITEEIEIVLIKNILKLLINRKDKRYDVDFKYSFVSVARSYLFEYDDQKIFDMITSNNFESQILDIIDSIVIDLDYLSLKEIIYEIIEKFDFYQRIILVGDVKNRINRLTSIINIFDNLSNICYSLNDAYDYLEKIIDDEYKIEVKELDVIPNSVTIMTIHGSKGLEFPICYFASMHSEFNIRELNDKFMYSDKYGIITPYFKEGIGKTFVKELLKDSYISEEISEKIRLFYVALTRPKEKFIIVTSFPSKNVYDVGKVKSFLDILTYCKDILMPYVIDLDINSLNLSKDYNLIKKFNYKEIIEKSDDLIKIDEVEIINTKVNKEKISKENNELLDKNTKDKMKFGTFMHQVLELADFKNFDKDFFEIDDKYKEKLKAFLDTIDVDNVINIYKEYEFKYSDGDSDYHGIIDLILEYKDKISIIDHKLKNVDDANYVKQLNSYKEYISRKTNKKIDIYLFSILSGTLTKLS